MALKRHVVRFCLSLCRKPIFACGGVLPTAQLFDPSAPDRQLRFGFGLLRGSDLAPAGAALRREIARDPSQDQGKHHG